MLTALLDVVYVLGAVAVIPVLFWWATVMAGDR